MYAVPVVISDDHDNVQFFQGKLINLIPELAGKSKIDAYARLKSPGWHKIDYGYWAFVNLLDSGERRVFVGIELKEFKPRKKIGDIPSFTKTQFEDYVASIVVRENSNFDAAEESLNLLVHDLRRLSTTIYHAGEEARGALDQRDYSTLQTRIDNILAAQGMLRLRTDYLDFTRKISVDGDKIDIYIFRKVDKVCRCFRPTAEKHNVTIHLQGRSYGTCTGPDIFEIVPYILIDNAIKYAPPNSHIQVECYDTESTIELCVASMGPVIEPDEKGKIFLKGFRSKAAQSGPRSGTGVGLSVAKEVVQHFNGSVWVEISDAKVPSQNGPYGDVQFYVSLPKDTAT
jgi:signal transduction histidine kinase